MKLLIESVEPGNGFYLDGEYVETFRAVACGHEVLDESEIDEDGYCVNCSPVPEM